MHARQLLKRGALSALRPVALTSRLRLVVLVHMADDAIKRRSLSVGIQIRSAARTTSKLRQLDPGLSPKPLRRSSRVNAAAMAANMAGSRAATQYIPQAGSSAATQARQQLRVNALVAASRAALGARRRALRSGKTLLAFARPAARWQA